MVEHSRPCRQMHSFGRGEKSPSRERERERDSAPGTGAGDDARGFAPTPPGPQKERKKELGALRGSSPFGGGGRGGLSVQRETERRREKGRGLP